MIIAIFPIGAPGSGKTTLKEYLKTRLPNFYSTERDYEFSLLRKNNSLKITRRLLFDQLEKFIEEIISINQKNYKNTYYVYFDSSNAKILGRERLYKKLNPEKIIEINFQFPKQLLLDRVKQREHLTFPINHIKQDEIITKISKNIEFSNSKDNRITKIYMSKSIDVKELGNLIICCYNIPFLS
tara:strand:- start:157 stop:708 length:552 start_codon:yes stop_codon:yes gene_type:complete